jgi:hypothetical protein
MCISVFEKSEYTDQAILLADFLNVFFIIINFFFSIYLFFKGKIQKFYVFKSEGYLNDEYSW